MTVNVNDTRIDTALKRFKDFLQYEEGLSNSTIKVYTQDVKQFVKSLYKGWKKAKVTSIYKNNVKDFLKMHMKKNSITTRNRKYSSLRKFFDFLEDNKHIRNNPMGKLKKIKTIKNKTPIYLTKDEINDFLEIINNDNGRFNLRNKAIVSLFLFCGMRREEVVKLNLDNIYMEERYIKFLGKGNKERIIPLHKKAFGIMEEYLEKRLSGDYFIRKGHKKALFTSLHGKRLSIRQINNIVDKYIEQMDIDKNITPHKLRHSFASYFYTKTKDLKTLQDILGHASIKTTQLYTHTDQEYKRKQINSLEY